jgi:hypothetical protein
VTEILPQAHLHHPASHTQREPEDRPRNAWTFDHNPRYILTCAAKHAGPGCGGHGRGHFVAYCGPTVAKIPCIESGGFLPSVKKSACLHEVSSAGGGTRTHTRLPPPDFESGKRCCRDLNGLANSAYIEGFLSLPCPALHRIAFPVVSEWCQVPSGLPGLVSDSRAA